MDPWTRKQTLDLINLFKQYPSLYNVHDSEYKNQIIRNSNLKTIADGIKRTRPTTSVEDIELKLKQLKSQFLKEKDRISLKQSGADTEQFYVPKLWCYNDLRFWEDTSDDISGTSNIALPLSEDAIKQLDILNADCLGKGKINRNHSETKRGCLPSTSQAASSYLRRKQRKTALERDTDEVFQLANRIVNTIANKRRFALRPFLEFLESELKDLNNAEILTDTRWKILDVVKEAQRNQTALEARIPTKQRQNIEIFPSKNEDDEASTSSSS